VNKCTCALRQHVLECAAAPASLLRNMENYSTSMNQSGTLVVTP
jgi:hypothetical protein